MADWASILKEIKDEQFQGPIDSVRQKYIKKLSNLTGRNVICYYSGFLTIPDHPDISISDRDLNGFMTVINKMDKSKGLDLLLHTPGGEVTATEALGNYIRKIFGKNIRVIVPQIAMSGGTMLACIGKVLIMGKHSSIGPIDPQYAGIPAYGVIQEFEKAKEEIIQNPGTIPIWQIIINKYHPTFIGQCYKSIELSQELVQKWLEKGGMFEHNPKKKQKIKKITEYLNNNEHTKIHSRHIDIDKAKEIGFNILELESQDDLQDAVLSVHHCYMHTFQNTAAVKIIENQNNVMMAFIADNIKQQ